VENTLVTDPWQAEAVPVIVGTGSGFMVMGRLDKAPFPHAPIPWTVMFPVVQPNVTVIVVVFTPAVITAPGGRAQRYPDAFTIVGVEYTTPVAPQHTLVGPVIAPAGPVGGQPVVKV
jgi:hypothetical protein